MKCKPKSNDDENLETHDWILWRADKFLLALLSSDTPAKTQLKMLLLDFLFRSTQHHLCLNVDLWTLHLNATTLAAAPPSLRRTTPLRTSSFSLWSKNVSHNISIRAKWCYFKLYVIESCNCLLLQSLRYSILSIECNFVSFTISVLSMFFWLSSAVKH